MRFAIVVHLTGTLVRLFSPAFIAPALVSAFYREWRDVIVFLVAIVAATWMLVAHVAALPYMAAGLGYFDAFFESMSGLTTTGATVFTDFGAFGRGIFFWRALTHWLGGLGVIALFIAVLPRLRIGGRELFFAEAAGPTDDKLTPQLRNTAIALWRVYVALTLLEVVALGLAGMPLFDAICN